MQKRVRAIIIEDGSLLTMKRVKTYETYWMFPGGGVEIGEDDECALIRECQEELGVSVDVSDLMFESSYVHKDSGLQKEYFYRCKITGGKLGTGDGPEYQENSNYEGTHELEWIKLSELEKINLRPPEVKRGVLELYLK